MPKTIKLCFLFLTLPNNAISEDLFRNLSANEKIEISSNISSNCTLHFKQQTKNIPNQLIQKMCSCVGREMAEMLVPYDILEESQKNPTNVTNYNTNFRKIQRLSSQKCEASGQ
jgi:hypothetical protein